MIDPGVACYVSTLKLSLDPRRKWQWQWADLCTSEVFCLGTLDEVMRHVMHIMYINVRR